MSESATRFVTDENMIVEELTWGRFDWLCRPDIVEADKLLVVRVLMPPGQAHEFHRHPEMEEVIYVIEGEAEQWVDQEMRMIGPGDSVHVPMDMVHATYNAADSTLVLLAILSPAKINGPMLVDVSQDEPWKSLRGQAS